MPKVLPQTYVLKENKGKDKVLSKTFYDKLNGEKVIQQAHIGESSEEQEDSKQSHSLSKDHSPVLPDKGLEEKINLDVVPISDLNLV